MNILHAHYSPEAPGLFFWEETPERAVEEPEVVVPLEEQMDHFCEFSASLEGFAVSIRPPTIEMPLVMRLGEANFIPAPGLEALLGPAYRDIQKMTIKTAYQESGEEG